jgi:hypothetical protein
MLGQNNPALAKLKTTAQQNINAGYRSAPQALATNLARRGLGSSGLAGKGMTALETSRLGDFSNLEGTMAGLSLDQQNKGASLAEQMLGMTMGTQSTGTQTDSGMGGLMKLIGTLGGAFLTGGGGMSANAASGGYNANPNGLGISNGFGG